MGFADELRASDEAERQRAQQAQDRKQREQAEAHRLIADFVATARELGIKAQRIKVRRKGRDGRPRTSSLHGWPLPFYMAVGEDGELYSTLVEGGLFGSWEPVRIEGIRLEWTGGHENEYSLRGLLLDYLQKNRPTN